MSTYADGHEAGTLQRHWPALAAIALAAAGLIAFVLIPLREPSATSPARPVVLQLGKAVLEIDSHYLRRGAQRAGGALERADLIIQWPDFQPAQLVVRDKDGHPAAAQPAHHLLVNVRAMEGANPAKHATALYGRFLDGDTVSNTSGLIMRRFKTSSPYADEELFVSPPDGEEFTARCPRQDAVGNINGRCLAQFRVGQVDMTVNFDAALLSEWQQVRDGAVNLIARALR